MKKIFLIIINILIVNCFSYSQYIENAIRISENNYGGTARFVSMGGAFGALGGDFSSISVNPAGIGVYRSSEFVISPGLTYGNVSSEYINNSIDANKYSMNMNNLSFVVSYDLEGADTRWVNVNFGVGFNRTNDFNKNIHFQGVNNNSLMEVFVVNANARALKPEQLDGMYEYLLYDALILGYDTTALEFFNEISDTAFVAPGNFEIFQQKMMETEGSVSEFNFSFGGNYANKLYLGASVGISRLRLKEYASHYETETDNLQVSYMNGFDFREYSTTTGTGINFKFGAIYRPLEFLRVGASLHLPTFYSLDQEFHNEVIGYFDDFNPEKRKSPVQNYSYGLNSPLRAVGSLGFQIGKVALIDVDYEYVNYSKMKMDDEENSQEVLADNREIQRIFQKTHNFRAGAEYRYGSLYFRAGGRYSTSPYQDVEGVLNPEFEKNSFAGGIGYREKKFFIDFAFSQTLTQYKISSYEYLDVNGVPINTALADIDDKLNKFILTFGVKF